MDHATADLEAAGLHSRLDLWSLFAYEDGHAPSLYLMSQEGTSSAGPVVAAIVARIFNSATSLHPPMAAGSTHPLTVVLDECANICRIEALPDLASHLEVQVDLRRRDIPVRRSGHIRVGSRSVRRPLECRDGPNRWGRPPGPGLREEAVELIGTHKVLETNHSRGSGGSTLSDHHVR